MSIWNLASNSPDRNVDCIVWLWDENHTRRWLTSLTYNHKAAEWVDLDTPVSHDRIMYWTDDKEALAKGDALMDVILYTTHGMRELPHDSGLYLPLESYKTLVESLCPVDIIVRPFGLGLDGIIIGGRCVYCIPDRQAP